MHEISGSVARTLINVENPELLIARSWHGHVPHPNDLIIPQGNIMNNPGGGAVVPVDDTAVIPALRMSRNPGIYSYNIVNVPRSAFHVSDTIDGKAHLRWNVFLIFWNRRLGNDGRLRVQITGVIYGKNHDHATLGQVIDNINPTIPTA